MDVASLVQSIITSFEEATSIVKRMRDRRHGGLEGSSEGVEDLLDSLSLGPVVVRGYFESDAKRYGAVYTAGDARAREELKDALISLQMTVLQNLGTVLLDDREPDLDAIQSASDDCRVNVGVCLGQLSQRLSETSRSHPHMGKMSAYSSGNAHPLRYSSSRSTLSSGRTRTTPMTPPESDTEWLGEAALNTPSRRKYKPRAPDFDVMNGMHSASYAGLYAGAQDNSSSVPLMLQRSLATGPPSLPRSADSTGTSPRDILPQTTYRATRASSVSTGTSTSRSEKHASNQTQSSRGVFGSDEPVNLYPEEPDPWGYFPEKQPKSRALSTPASDQDLTVRNKIKDSKMVMQSQPISIRRPTTPLSLFPKVPINHSQQNFARPTIPEEAPMIQESRPELRSVQSSMTVQSQQTVISNGSGNNTLQRVASGPLNLPTDKNLIGYCKGAFKLQAGMEKKAFKLANRPIGLSGMVSYWQCDKCNFEGPLHSLNAPGQKKPEKVFDPTIRDFNGIRYKWAFLAKCHVQLKSLPEGKRDGTFGSFACIFCTAESGLRGWPTGGGNFSAGKASERNSGSSTSSTGTTIFGNIHSFMDHLQMHRQQEFWPGVEMQGRMKCIVGRIPERGEDFDINLLPL